MHSLVQVVGCREYDEVCCMLGATCRHKDVGLKVYIIVQDLCFSLLAVGCRI